MLLLHDIRRNDPLYNYHVFGRHGKSDIYDNCAQMKSCFRGAPPMAILPSREYPMVKTNTTALCYRALTNILPQVAGVVMFVAVIELLHK